MKPTGKEKKTTAPRIPLLEWICAALGLLIVLTLISFTTYNAIKGDDSDPEVKTEILGVKAIEEGFLVRIRAINKGGTAAAGVVIQGSLNEGDKEIESSEFTFDYLPSHSKSEGGLFFTMNPSEKNLKVRALGYQKP